MTLYLSASSIKDFISCRKKFYYRTNFKWEGEVTPPLKLGSAVHHILENYWEDEEFAFSNSNKVYDRFNLTKSLRTQANKLVSNYFSHFRELVSKGDLVEYTFKVPYSDDIYMVGKYDRVLNNDVVLDYKTSRYVPEDISDDPQFIIYYMSYLQEFKKEPNLLYAALVNGNLRKYRFDERYVKALYDEVIPDMIDTIESNSYPRDGMYKKFYGKLNCEYCIFKDFCYKQLREELK